MCTYIALNRGFFLARPNGMQAVKYLHALKGMVCVLCKEWSVCCSVMSEFDAQRIGQAIFHSVKNLHFNQRFVARRLFVVSIIYLFNFLGAGAS